MIALVRALRAEALKLKQPWLLRSVLGENANLDLFNSLVANWRMLFLWLAAAWTLAAFVEEMVYRGYILNRVADLFEGTSSGLWVGVLANSVLFGIAHSYQGIVGALRSLIFGLVISGIYATNTRNIWVCMLFHGVFDTIGIISIFLGVNL